MDETDELLNLVDENDQIIGTILRSQTNELGHKGFLRAAEAFIQNSTGKLWIPRRPLSKRIAPGGLDYSMGEHVKAGEDYLQACLRRFKEELNLELTEAVLEFVHKFPPTRELDYFRSLYIYRSNQVPKYNPEDFTEYFWLSPKELLDQLNRGELAKRSLSETVTYLINRS